jgi:hypothetical protein
MKFAEGKTEFEKLFNLVDKESQCRFARWVGGFCEGKIDELQPTEVEETLNQIGDVLRREVDAPGGKLNNEIVRNAKNFL